MPSMNHLRSAPSTKNAKILMDGLIAVARHCDGLQRGRLRADALGAKRRRGVTLSEKSAACFNYCDLHDVADGDAQICGGSVALEVAAKPILPHLGYGGRNGGVDIHDDKTLARIIHDDKTLARLALFRN